jgi:hypothetical protein
MRRLLMRQPTGVAWRLMEPNWLNPREDRAWRAFVYAHQHIEVHLNRRLQKSGLSGADYEVLAVLSALDGDRMPAHALCNALRWEKSRLSHQVRRMQKDGLISPSGWPRRHREGGARARGGRPPKLHRPAHPG